MPEPAAQRKYSVKKIMQDSKGFRAPVLEQSSNTCVLIQTAREHTTCPYSAKLLRPEDSDRALLATPFRESGASIACSNPIDRSLAATLLAYHMPPHGNSQRFSPVAAIHGGSSLRAAGRFGGRRQRRRRHQ